MYLFSKIKVIRDIFLFIMFIKKWVIVKNLYEGENLFVIVNKMLRVKFGERGIIFNDLEVK